MSERPDGGVRNPGMHDGKQRTRPARALAAVKSGLSRYSRDFIKAAHQHSHDILTRGESLRRTWQDASADAAAMHAAWLGHCTVLMNIGGRTVLTDPVLSGRIGMRLGPWTIGPPRLNPAHVRPECLPPVDLLLISHAHFDHLDKPTLRALAHERTTVVTPKGVGRLIPRGFGEVIELPWDRDIDAAGLRIGALRPKHWGARTAWDRHRQFNSYLIEHAGTRTLFAGDTAHTDRFAKVGKVDLAVFGIGAYEPWIHAHANPEQVWDMFTSMPGRHLLPVHHSTFRLSDEPREQPMQRLLAVAGTASSCILHPEEGLVHRVNPQSA